MRHTEIPPFARTYEPAHREVLGHFENGEYISHRAQLENEKYRWTFLDVLSVASAALIVAILALGPAWCLMD